MILTVTPLTVIVTQKMLILFIRLVVFVVLVMESLFVKKIAEENSKCFIFPPERLISPFVSFRFEKTLTPFFTYF